MRTFYFTASRVKLSFMIVSKKIIEIDKSNFFCVVQKGNLNIHTM